MVKIAIFFSQLKALRTDATTTHETALFSPVHVLRDVSCAIFDVQEDDLYTELGRAVAHDGTCVCGSVAV